MKGYTAVASLAIVATLLANSVFAQARENQPRTTTTQGEQRQIQLDDRALASCVAIANQKEVAITQFAKDKLKDEDVKKFAQMIIEDHQGFLQKLQKFTPEAGRANWLAQSDSDTGVQRAGGTQETGANRIQQTSAQREAKPTGQGQRAQGVDLIQLQREVAQECLSTAKQKLTEDKEKIDKCFLGMQAAAHMAMLDHLTVLQRHTSGELNQVLSDASQTTQKHLDKAEALLKEMKDEKSSKKD